MFALFSEFGARTRFQDLWPFVISETGLKFLRRTQGKIQPGQPGSYEETLIVFSEVLASPRWARKVQISENYYLYFLASKIFF